MACSCGIHRRREGNGLKWFEGKSILRNGGCNGLKLFR